MKDKFFLDTNILVYSFSPDIEKEKISKGLVETALKSKKGAISYQVVQEFINVSTKKFTVPFTFSDIKLYTNFILLPLCTVHSSFVLFDKALDIKNEFKYSFYDSLIIASALESGCKILYSEDLQNRQRIGSLEIINPFYSK
jgi:predicted nucleic acid-binding protein